MKRKLVLVLALALLAPALLFADIIQLGLNVGYGLNYEEIGDFLGEDLEIADYFKIENFSFAPELRVNLLIFQLDVVAPLSFGSDYFKADAVATAGLQLSLGFIRLAAGAGISTPVVYEKSAWTIGGTSADNFLEVLTNSSLLYKLSIGIPLNKVEIVANWLIPADGSFNDVKGDISKIAPSIADSTFSIGLLFNLL